MSTDMGFGEGEGGVGVVEGEGECEAAPQVGRRGKLKDDGRDTSLGDSAEAPRERVTRG